MGNVLSDYRSRRTPQPRPKPENTLQQMLATLAQQRGAQGGPDSQDLHQMQLRALMQRQDPARFMSLQRRGFDPSAGAEYAGVSGDAELLPDELNPAVQMSPNVVQSEAPQMVDPRGALRQDLIMRSMGTQRGWDQGKANEANNAALRARLGHLRESPVPADYGDGDNSYTKRILQMLFSVTGQGGGMRP